MRADFSPDHVSDVSSEASALSTLDDGRRHPRSHLFVAAALYTDRGSAPVRIRNMSQYGALIEAPAVPEPGTAVVLKRGSLEVAGEIAWKAGQKAGIALATSVNVADWMSRKAGAHQERVDEIVSNLKSGKPSDPVADVAGKSSDALAELEALRADLARLAAGLAADAILVATHPEIQMVDIALQRVDRITGQLRNS